MHYDPMAVPVSQLAALSNPSMSFFKFHILFVLNPVTVAQVPCTEHEIHDSFMHLQMDHDLSPAPPRHSR